MRLSAREITPRVLTVIGDAATGAVIVPSQPRPFRLLLAQMLVTQTPGDPCYLRFQIYNGATLMWEMPSGNFGAGSQAAITVTWTPNTQIECSPRSVASPEAQILFAFGPIPPELVFTSRDRIEFKPSNGAAVITSGILLLHDLDE